MDDLVRLRFIFFILALGFVTDVGPLQAQPRTDNPVYHANQLLNVLEKEGATAFAKAVITALDSKASEDAIISNMQPLEKRTPKFRAVALDRNYGDAVRQIIIYQYMLTENHPFSYFRFVYKMTDTGWRITAIRFNTENTQLFPEEYGID
jgi:hypothetical protein